MILFAKNVPIAFNLFLTFLTLVNKLVIHFMIKIINKHISYAVYSLPNSTTTWWYHIKRNTFNLILNLKTPFKIKNNKTKSTTYFFYAILQGGHTENTSLSSWILGNLLANENFLNSSFYNMLLNFVSHSERDWKKWICIYFN